MGERPPRHPLVELTLYRIRSFLREPEAVFWTFFFPVLLALALGIAFRNRVARPAPVALLAGEGAEAVRDALLAGGELRLVLLDSLRAEEALRRGDVGVVIRLTPAGVVYRYDPTRAEARLARLKAELLLTRPGGDGPPQVDDLVTEAGSRYVDFVVPGLVALNLLGTGLWGVGYAIVELRRRKLLKRFLATPMRRSHFLLGFAFARLAFLGLELLSLLLVVRFAFHVRIRGSLPLFLAVAVLGALAFSGIGLLVASRVRTVEGAQGLMNLVMVPMWILSGVFFSSSHFPDAMQPLIRALPLTPLVDALRAVMLEGAGAGEVAVWVGQVAAWGVASFVVAVRIFRWS